VNDENKMSFIEHLEELRKRLIHSIIAVFVGMIICWFFREQILSFLLEPLYQAWRQVDGLPEPKPLNFSSMIEPFIAYLKLSALGGVFLGAPVILYHIWKFVAPGLYNRERRLALPFVLFSTLLFVVGSIMAYYMVFPIGFRFFLDFAAGLDMVELEASVSITRVMDETNRSQPIPLPTPKQTVNEEHRKLVDGGEPDAAPPNPIAVGDGGTNESAQAPIDAPEENEASTKEEQQPEAWYSVLLSRWLRGECATFNATEGKEGTSVALRLEWHKAQCGNTPKLIKVKRDGQLLPVAWDEATEPRPGYVAMTAMDRHPVKPTHLYTLLVPKNPGEKRLAPVLMVKDYLSFAIRILLAFGLIFELPILISFLSIAGIVNYKQLLRFSRWFLVIAVVIAALLTPPDVITQCMMAGPLMVLYEIGIIGARIFGKKKPIEEAPEPEESSG